MRSCSFSVPSSKRLASACTRTFVSNTIYGGEEEGEYKAVTGLAVVVVGKRGRGKVAKRGTKNVISRTDRRKEARKTQFRGLLQKGMGEMIGG